jgi:hypothetical protein
MIKSGKGDILLWFALLKGDHVWYDYHYDKGFLKASYLSQLLSGG